MMKRLFQKKKNLVMLFAIFLLVTAVVISGCGGDQTGDEGTKPQEQANESNSQAAEQPEQ